MGFITTLDPRDVREVFIETGYGWGQSLPAIVEMGFDEIYSIEIDPNIAWGAYEKWRPLGVNVICGDSRVVLPEIVDPARPTTFWLDAHYSGGLFGEARPPVECPVLEELDAILDFDWTAPRTILVDDVRLFSPGARDRYERDESQWPALEELVGRLDDYELDWAAHDILVARS